MKEKFQEVKPFPFGKILPVWVILILLASVASALEVPERPSGRVTDFTRTLSPAEIANLDQKLSAFERETTNQVAVLLIPSPGGDSLEDYSIRLAEKWKIGQKGRNNGVILLIVKNDHKLRIEVGYGLEGALPDSLAGAIIRGEIAPRFRNGQFYQGIDAGLTAIMAAVKGEYRPPPKKGAGGLNPYLVLLLFLVIFGSAIIMSHAGRRRHYHSGGAGGWSSGGGFFGGPWGGSGGGGGFSGGGGDFGGGGASGNW